MAEDFKAKGNAAYHNRDFDRAADWYTKAIDADPQNAVFYNNRAAAYLEMKQWSKAATDAERAAILAPSAKANARHGKALAQLGQIPEAIAAYERALRHDHGSVEYEGAIRSLKGGVPPPVSAGASGRGQIIAPSRKLGLDAVLVASAVIAFITMIFAPGFAVRAWQAMLICMVLRQLLTLVERNGADALRSFGFWKQYATTRLLKDFEGLYLVLCLVFFLTGAPPQHLFLASSAIYATVDIAVNLRGELQRAAPPALMARFGQHIDTIRNLRDQLIVNAAAFEAMAVFFTPISGCPLIATLAVTQFAKWRYQNDSVSRMAWSMLHRQVAGYAHSPRAPGVIGTVFDKMAALLHRAAQS